jgi:hypothetical protein
MVFPQRGKVHKGKAGFIFCDIWLKEIKIAILKEDVNWKGSIMVCGTSE